MKCYRCELCSDLVPELKTADDKPCFLVLSDGANMPELCVFYGDADWKECKLEDIDRVV